MSGRAKTSSGGFTLIEVLASLVVLAVLGSVASSLLVTATDAYLGSSTHGRMHAELSIGLDRAVRELRRVPLDITAVPRSPNIDSITATSVHWRDEADEACALELDNGNLMLTVAGGAPALLLREVDALTVTALNDEANPVVVPATAAACDAIRQIVLQITKSVNGETETLRACVFLRCTMSTTP